MTALLDRFGLTSPRVSELTSWIKTAEENLSQELTKEQRKLLLRLTDSQKVLREEARLCGFISGYRLAEGIHRELDEFPRFSIVDEERNVQGKSLNRKGVSSMAKRRTNGEGNIRKRKDGRWEGRYTAGYDSNGKCIIKNVLGRTQAEVKAKLKDAVALADVSNVAMTVSRILHQSSHIFCRRREAKI